ncbi:iron-sulfur cluster biosynthesis family protein [Weissella confusa]|uniref:iron-sulfur cluster biosynthesis family protein n=1 Tax=Weissella confusa TaxID=1583 RepID=UPI00178139B0|nr:iron-sulfur cluster biosynthesis family protein [Weissella confusa]MBD5833381.1 iron-sulfur cluster biosynthesis family protein [Weissella confusa]
MYLTITDAAMEKINPILKAEPGRRLIMMYEDGVSPYSHHGEVAMQVSFVFAVIRGDQPLEPWFDETIDSNIGPLPIKGYSKDYMVPNMVLDVKKFGGVVLPGDAGVIDDTPEIRDETKATD